MPEWLQSLAVWAAGLSPAMRYVALAVAGVAAGYWAGPALGKALLPLLQRFAPAPLRALIDTLLGDPLHASVRALTDHVEGRRALAASAVPVIRAGVALSTGQAVGSDTAAKALASLAGAEAHPEASPDTAAAVLRAGQALANGAAPAPKDVTAARSVLGTVPAVVVPGDPQVDAGTRIEIRIRRGADLLSDVELRIPEEP